MTTQTKVTDDQQTAGQSTQSTMQIEPENTALVVTDPQNDVLSERESLMDWLDKASVTTARSNTSNSSSRRRR